MTMSVVRIAMRALWRYVYDGLPRSSLLICIPPVESSSRNDMKERPK